MMHKKMGLRSLQTFAFCGLLLMGVSAAVAEETTVIFPDPASAYPKGGTFVSTENLHNVTPGLNKNQMYALLGTPQFSEGVFAVRVWNYVLNFHRNGELVTCQYQVQFDDNMLVKQTVWSRPECEDF